MFKTNEYFDGKVMSMAFESEEGPCTIGVMAAGEYTFGTSAIEYMTVTSGVMQVLLPGATEWKSYKAYDTFIVEANTSFQVKLEGDTSYKCMYK